MRFRIPNWVMQILMGAISNVHAGHRFPTPGIDNVSRILKICFFLRFTTQQSFYKQLVGIKGSNCLPSTADI